MRELTANTVRQVLVLGATGTIGQAVTHALVAAGHKVTCFVRPAGADLHNRFPNATLKFGDVTSSDSLCKEGFGDDRFDAVVSCLGSRSGNPDDAWAIDCQANKLAITTAKKMGVQHFIYLSAICVQKPELAFQFAKLAAEEALVESGLTYSIVRPTAFFKSLSGQIERVKAGKPFLIFGNGELTACKPISDQDLAIFIVDCLSDTSRHNRVLPIGGPGRAITPKMQGEALFAAIQKPAKYKSVPVSMLSVIIAGLSGLGVLIPKCKDKAELARIGRYYATESMLIWDAELNQYNADGTPSTGVDTLSDHYLNVIRNNIKIDLGDHSVF